MTDSELYQIVKDVPRELWPEHLAYGSDGLWRKSDRLTGSYDTAHALLIWEGKLSGVVNEHGLVEDVSDDGEWACGAWMPTDQVWYPTRIEAIVVAVKESQ